MPAVPVPESLLRCLVGVNKKLCDLFDVLPGVGVVVNVVTLYALGYFGVSLYVVAFVAFVLWNLQKTSAARFKRKLKDQFVKFDKNPALVRSVLSEKGVLPLPKWVTFPDFECVHWLNTAVQILWPGLKQATEEAIRQSVDPILESFRPGFLKSVKFGVVHLGNMPLHFDAFKVTDPKYLKGDNQVILDATVEFGKLGDAHITVEATSRIGIAVDAELADIRLSGDLRIVLADLCPVYPGFRVLKVAFLSEPKLEYSLNAVKIPLSHIPGFAQWLTSTIAEALSASMVVPNAIEVPLFEDPSAAKPSAEQIAAARRRELEGGPKVGDLGEMQSGVLRVTVVECRDLEDVETFSKSDPFCKLWLEHYPHSDEVLLPFHKDSGSGNAEMLEDDKEKEVGGGSVGVRSGRESQPPPREEQRRSASRAVGSSERRHEKSGSSKLKVQLLAAASVRKCDELPPQPLEVKKQRTRVIEDKLNPVFNETFEFTSFGKDIGVLAISVHSDRHLGKAKHLGHLRVPITQLSDGAPHCAWFQLQNAKRGSVFLKLEYQPFVEKNTKEDSVESDAKSEEVMEVQMQDIDMSTMAAAKHVPATRSGATALAPLIATSSISRKRKGVDGADDEKESTVKLSDDLLMSSIGVGADDEAVVKSKKHAKESDTGDKTLVLRLLGARNLEGNDAGGLCDPYAKVSVVLGSGGKKIKVKRTKTLKKTTKPLWNESFYWPLVSAADRQSPESHIDIVVKDKDFLRDDLLGTLKIPLDDVCTRKGGAVWKRMAATGTGEIQLETYFY